MGFTRAKNNTKQILFEIGAELKIALDQLQAQVVSSEFEARLDRLIDRAGEREKFERLVHCRPQAKKSLTLVRSHGSIDSDPIDFDLDDLFECDIPVTYALAGRRERVGLKLAFLSRIARHRIGA
jgi:hypothetical protein